MANAPDKPVRAEPSTAGKAPTKLPDVRLVKAEPLPTYPVAVTVP